MTARARGFTLRRTVSTDPPSAASSRKPTLARSVFDQRRLAAAWQQGLIDGIPVELPPPYNDERLIAIVIELGMPRWSAEQMRGHPQLRLAYVGLALDVEEAAKGDRAARERVDAVRERFVLERRAERISDIPDRATGYVDTPGGSSPTRENPKGLEDYAPPVRRS